MYLVSSPCVPQALESIRASLNDQRKGKEKKGKKPPDYRLYLLASYIQYSFVKAISLCVRFISLKRETRRKSGAIFSLLDHLSITLRAYDVDFEHVQIIKPQRQRLDWIGKRDRNSTSPSLRLPINCNSPRHHTLTRLLSTMPTSPKSSMSYLPLSTIPARPTLSDDKELGTTSEPQTPYPRRSSTFPLLDSRRTSTSSGLPDADDWVRLRQDRTSYRKVFIWILVIAFALVSIAVWCGQNEEGITWAMRLGAGGKSPVAFLLRKPTKRNPNGFRRVLTNPVEPSLRLQYDVTLTLDSIPLHITAGETNSLVVRCAHADLGQCAKSYRILFIGPTIRATYFSDSQVIDDRHVKVNFKIDDPGTYQIYGWPEFDECDFWSREEFWTGPKCENRIFPNCSRSVAY